MWRTLNSDIATKSSKTVFNPDGSITVTSDNSTKTTVFESNGDIVSTMEVHDEGGLISTRTVERVVFNQDGSIENRVSSENIDQ